MFPPNFPQQGARQWPPVSARNYLFLEAVYTSAEDGGLGVAEPRASLGDLEDAAAFCAAIAATFGIMLRIAWCVVPWMVI